MVKQSGYFSSFAYNCCVEGSRMYVITYTGRKLVPVCSDFCQIFITCPCPHSLLYLSFSMLFNLLWFLPCWCVSQLIQKPTEFWKGKKWEERLRKREREDGRMCLISASLLFRADRLRAVEPLYFLVHVRMLQRTDGLKKKTDMGNMHTDIS